VAARKSSPLAVGVTEGNAEFFIASDASPIAEYTKQIVYLNDEEMAVIERGKSLQVYNLNGEIADAEVKEVNVDLSMLDHEGYPHFMLKEIFDQPNVLKDCMRGRIVDSPYSGPQVILSAVTNNRRQLLNAKRIVIVSCGTSWHAGLIGKQLIEHFCRIPVEVAYASEFRYSDPVIGPEDVVMAISQSGETADTLAAIQLAKERGALIFGIVNGVGSSIARESDTGTYIHVGPEIGVASTKAFTGQVVVLTMLALALGMAKGTVGQEEYEETIKELLVIPDKIKKILEQNDKIQKLATTFTYAHNFLYLGRGWNYPVALEGALKLKEISYIHAEGYPAAEMKHGPIALVDNEMPVVFIATHHKLYQKIISNMQEVISRHGRIIAIVTEGDEQVKNMVSDVIEIPQTLACLAPLLSVIPLQLLSYHVAVVKGLNVDQPRNLAKSVTVE
jgi:glucosamine--fructose-6-phosphate aminotransferase (isomerizing)